MWFNVWCLLDDLLIHKWHYSEWTYLVSLLFWLLFPTHLFLFWLGEFFFTGSWTCRVNNCNWRKLFTIFFSSSILAFSICFLVFKWILMYGFSLYKWSYPMAWWYAWTIACHRPCHVAFFIFGKKINFYLISNLISFFKKIVFTKEK